MSKQSCIILFIIQTSYQHEEADLIQLSKRERVALIHGAK